MASTTHVWQLVQGWVDGQRFPPSQAAVARHLGVQRSAVSQWKTGKAHPTPENLRALAGMTGLPYERFLDALLRDQGYLRTETYDATPISQAPGSGAVLDDAQAVVDEASAELERDPPPSGGSSGKKPARKVTARRLPPAARAAVPRASRQRPSE